MISLLKQKIYVQNYITLIDNFASPVNYKRLIIDIKNYKDIKPGDKIEVFDRKEEAQTI